MAKGSGIIKEAVEEVSEAAGKMKFKNLSEDVKERLNPLVNKVKKVSGDIKGAVHDSIGNKKTVSEDINDLGKSASSVGDNDAETAKNVMDTATEKNGLGLFRLAKKHPTTALGVVMGTAWGVSELTEDNDF